MKYKWIIACGAALVLTSACSERSEQAEDGTLELRFGHFPNITHVQGLVAHHMSRSGQGWYERRVSEILGQPVRVSWYCYNAGPSAMEALFARSLDVTYVGPSPAINAYVKAKGREVRLIAGAVEGGAALVVPAHSTATRPQDFRGCTLATPQLGNTQDVSCRAWLTAGGLRLKLTGGDALIMPTRNAEQITLFSRGHFAGVWTVEPWVSRLQHECGGRVLVEEKDALTTVLAAGEDFLKRRPAAAAAVRTAHTELCRWINEHPEEAQQMVLAELKELTKGSLDASLVCSAWQRIRITPELSESQLQHFVRDAYAAGFLRKLPDISSLIDTSPTE